MTRLVVAPEAETDTNTILSYLERQAGAGVAREYRLRFIETIERIVAMPLSGAPRSLLGQNVRISVVSPYVVIYEYERIRDEVTLLRILHGRRHVSRILQGE